jgi:DNA-binding NtrC family response regulator
MHPKTPVTLVMSPTDPSYRGITRQLRRLGIFPQTASNLQEACDLFRLGQPHTVISGVTLADGNWCALLAHTVRSEVEAKFFVCAATADERLWSEAVWRGAHDVLVEPFDLLHLRCVLGLGARSQQETCGPEFAADPVCA